MQKFEFRFTCANSGLACQTVKGLMEGFDDILDAKDDKHFDHTGVITLDSIDKAFEVKQKLESKAGKLLSSIEIAAL